MIFFEKIEESPPEIYIYKYFVTFSGIDDANDVLDNAEYKDFTQHGLHSMISDNFCTRHILETNN